MHVSFTGLCLSTCFASVLAISAASAEVVEIESLDGSIRVIGELIEYDGIHFSIETALGVLKVAANTANCTGDACPDTATKFADFTMSGLRVLTDELMPRLLADYAFHRDASNTFVSEANGTNVFRLESEFSGAV